MIRRALTLTLDAIAPLHCAACDAVAESDLCVACADELSAQAQPPAQRRQGLVIRAAFPFDGIAREALHAAKYAHRLGALRLLAALATERLAVWPPPGALVPVPTTPRRRRARGFDQGTVVAEVAARGMAGAGPVVHGLSRSPTAGTQVGQDAAGRAARLSGAFVWTQPPLRESVWLVDDTVTTGATLAAAARALQHVGARRIEGVAVAAAL